MEYLRASAFVLVSLLVPACLVGRDLTMAEPATGESPILPATGTNADDAATEDEAASPAPDGGATGETPSKPIDGGALVDASEEDAADTGPPVPRCPAGKNDEVEPNGLPLVGDQLPIGTFCGSIYRPNDTDVLKLDLGAAGALRIAFDATGDARIVLRGAGQTIEGASGTRHDFVSSGAWTITIQSPGGNLQNWVLVRE